MNNHLAPFKAFQAQCHNHLAENDPSLAAQTHYGVAGLMTGRRAGEGSRFGHRSPSLHPSPLSLQPHSCLCLRLKVKGGAHVHGDRCRVCSVDGATVPGMWAGSQSVVLPRFCCLLYKAVRSNEGATHKQQRRKHPQPLLACARMYML